MPSQRAICLARQWAFNVNATVTSLVTWVASTRRTGHATKRSPWRVGWYRDVKTSLPTEKIR